jgi:prepilin-type processing-associated H-X9-DG protein
VTDDHDDLPGYLLDLLDPAERAAVAARLAADPAAAARLAHLRTALPPLAAEASPEPPPDLALRTLARVAEYVVATEPRRSANPTPIEVIAADVAPERVGPRRLPVTDRPEARTVGGRFRIELVVAAGVAFLGVGLAATFVMKVRQQSDTVACQANLMTLNQGLAGYADANAGRFPQVGTEPYPVAGSFVAALAEAGQVPPGFRPACPAAGGTPVVDARAVPTVAVGYAYTLGHRGADGYVLGPRRASGPDEENDLIPVCADIPAGSFGAPHAHGQNVLFAGGHVRFATVPTVGINGDDIYRNNLGRVAAGLDRVDAVLGVGADRP